MRIGREGALLSLCWRWRKQRTDMHKTVLLRQGVVSKCEDVSLLVIAHTLSSFRIGSPLTEDRTLKHPVHSSSSILFLAHLSRHARLLSTPTALFRSSRLLYLAPPPLPALAEEEEAEEHSSPRKTGCGGASCELDSPDELPPDAPE